MLRDVVLVTSRRVEGLAAVAARCPVHVRANPPYGHDAFGHSTLR